MTRALSCLQVVCLAAVYFAASGKASLQPPVDPVLPGWSLAKTLCAECGEGTACGVLDSYSQVNFSDGRVAAYAQGSALTCYKKDYSFDFHATVGGRCVPSLAGDFPVETFCEAVLPAKVSGRHLSSTWYQALAEQTKVCEPCCDGHFACGGDLVCKRPLNSDSPGGYCAHADRTSLCFEDGESALFEVKCDSSLPDFSSRRQLTGEMYVAPAPPPNPGDQCFQLALAGEIQQLIHLLESQPFHGRDLIGQLPAQLAALEAFVFANFLLGAWSANKAATSSAVITIFEQDVTRSTRVFTELIGSSPHSSAFIYTSVARTRIDLSAVVLSQSLLSAHPVQAQLFLTYSATVRAFTAGTMWGTSYKVSATASLDLIAHATAAANVTSAGKLARAATVAQEYASITVSAKEFAYLATSAGAPKENLAKFANVWRGA